MTLLDVSDLTMYYSTTAGDVRAIDGVSFGLDTGKTLGIAGESGSGKTSIAMTLLRLLPYNGVLKRGSVRLNGVDLLGLSEDEMRKVRWKQISLIPQASMNSLDPVFKVGDQIAEAILVHEDVSRQEALERAKDLLEMVGIHRDRVGSYPHEFSGGMKQRAAIAMALALRPPLVIADEPTTALDVIVQAEILELLMDIKKKFSMSMLMITHDLSIISEVADDVLIMYAGKVVEKADVFSLYGNPLHPYTLGLLGAFPDIRAHRRRLVSIPGSPPDLTNLPTGCNFYPRCPYAKDRCKVEEPELREVEPGHWVACHFAEEIAASRGKQVV
ncbi:MAG: ABC transporter ATP-binding protein [TACK group archaeon]|nr:ABC transporter ATP-binding protein [TACK group archaeon]